MGVGVRKSQNNGPVTGALFFSSPRLALYTRFPLRAKRRVRLNLAPPGGGGDSHMKQTGMLVGNFEFNP